MPLVASFANSPLSAAFLVYVSLVAVLVSAVLVRYLPLGRALAAVAVVAVWFGYAGIMGYAGIVGRYSLRIELFHRFADTSI